MPHGWAIAEFWLLMRDCVAFEDNDRLVLFAGVPAAWFRAAEGMRAKGLATYFGSLDVTYKLVPGGAELTLAGAMPPAGHILRLPPALRATIRRGGQLLPVQTNGDCLLPPGINQIRLQFS